MLFIKWRTTSKLKKTKDLEHKPVTNSAVIEKKTLLLLSFNSKI